MDMEEKLVMRTDGWEGGWTDGRWTADGIEG